MIYIVVIALAHVMFLASACPEPITTVHIQNHDGPIYVSPSDRLPYDNQITIGNHSPTDCYGTCGNRQSSCGNQSPIYPSCCNQSRTCPSCGNHTPHLLHNSNYPNYHTVCESDCKCVTKQLGTCVPINTVPQNLCSAGTYYSAYPDYGSYGYAYYPEGQYGSDGSCPIASESLIPLLKSYLGQSKCPKHGCQCGQSY